MIYYFSPYSIEKNIGKSYNEYCRLVPNETHWICLIDADTMFLTYNYGHQIQELIDKYPDAGLFTCLTNRVNNLEQCYNHVISEETNILEHKKIAEFQQQNYYLSVKQLTRVISGHFMLFQKKTWLEAGGFCEQGMLRVDNKFSKQIMRVQKKILLAEGIYVLHYYRLLEGRKFIKHLI
jgi:hypothetical protein